MIKKLIERYLLKHKMHTMTQKEYENLGRYRSARGELKQIIDEYNRILFKLIQKTSISDLKLQMTSAGLEFKPNEEKKELQERLYTANKKEFK